MSITHAADVLQIPSLEPTRKLVLLALGLMTDHQGRGTISAKELADATGLSARSLRTIRGELTRRGLIEARPYDHDVRLVGTSISNLIR